MIEIFLSCRFPKPVIHYYANKSLIWSDHPWAILNFADDTNLLIINKSLKRLNKLLNIDLKNLTNWLNANKSSLNISKTELIIFKPKRKPLDFNMKIKLNGKRLYPTDSVRYLGVKIDSKLNWNSHVNAIATKLN